MRSKQNLLRFTFIFHLLSNSSAHYIISIIFEYIAILQLLAEKRETWYKNFFLLGLKLTSEASRREGFSFEEVMGKDTALQKILDVKSRKVNNENINKSRIHSHLALIQTRTHTLTHMVVFHYLSIKFSSSAQHKIFSFMIYCFCSFHTE